MKDSEIMDAALEYAEKLGWPIFPCHGITDGRCTCPDPACSSPGKHPRTSRGFKDATTNKTQIRNWWSRWPGANLGVPTGKASGVSILDVDLMTGGLDTLDDLEEANGSIPRTATAATGGGGTHFLFDCTDLDWPNSAGKVGPGLDVRGCGGYFVAPPSRHSSGRDYRWMHAPLETPLIRPPDWLRELVERNMGNGTHPAPPTEIHDGTIPEGQRHTTLTSIAGALRYRGLNAPQIAALLHGINQEHCQPRLPESQIDRIASDMGDRPPKGPTFIASVAPTEGADVAENYPWPSALADAAFHGLAGDFVRAVLPDTESDPAALLFQFLSFYGNTIGDGPHFRVESTRHSGRIFLCLVGATAIGRKGTAEDRVRQIFEWTVPDWVSNSITTGLSTGEGLIFHVRDEVRKQTEDSEGNIKEVLVDEGVSDKRLLVIETEFAKVLRVMARDTNTLSAVLRSAWDRGDLRSMTKSSPYRATGAHVSVIGHITKEELLRFISETEMANGFGNRFLWPVVRRSKHLPHGGMGVDEPVVYAIVERLRKAIDFATGAGQVARSPEASKAWETIYMDLEQPRFGLAGAMLARAAAHVTRLSFLYAMLDLSPVIRPDHQDAALALWRYNEESVRYIFGTRFGSPKADTLLAELQRRGADGMDRQDMQALFSRHVSRHELDAALKLLEDSQAAISGREATGGRNREVWRASRYAT
ncbi:MAG: bifunctional DNA primase/polymerase [Planctomycetota bacterium]|nr:bifunctional DNA primase/polymerase [Planctomycetota bacterium]